ncbi:MAG: nucleotidyltransferase family protein [Kordiimonadaceae bacterium]|nr:nucleotidyltransferase family protein [Kordiimonadaceae bacterium]
MILAAGKGSRMGVQSATVPKPLTVVAGQTLLARLLHHLRAALCTQVVVNVHHLPEKIEAALEPEIETGYVTISDERSGLLETGGGVKKALPLLGADPFYVVNGDALWVDASADNAFGNLARLKALWDGAQMDVLLLLVKREDALGYEGVGDFFAEGNSDVLQVEFRNERPDAPYVFGGVQLVAPDAYTDMPEGSWSNREIFRAAAKKGRLRGLLIDGHWMHVGTMGAVAEAEQKLAEIGAA